MSNDLNVRVAILENSIGEIKDAVIEIRKTTTMLAVESVKRGVIEQRLEDQAKELTSIKGELVKMREAEHKVRGAFFIICAVVPFVTTFLINKVFV